MISAMASLYAEDLAYIQAAAFGTLAQGAAPEVLRRLNTAAVPISRSRGRRLRRGSVDRGADPGWL
jgi:hypothetical protein